MLDVERLLHSDEFTRTLVVVESRVETLTDSLNNLLRDLKDVARATEGDDAGDYEGARVAVSRFADQITADLHRLHALHTGRR